MKIHSAEHILSAMGPAQFRRDGRPEIAFVGRSNVGKSSLMNRLLARKNLARTSSRPGRTQAVNYFLVNDRFYFVDLPGYGYAKASRTDRERWARLMDLYFRDASRRHVLLVQLVDAKVGATVLDEQGAEYFYDLGLAPAVVATKIDKVPRSKRVKQLRSIDAAMDAATPDSVKPPSAIAVSAQSGEGIGTLWQRLHLFLNSPSQDSSSQDPSSQDSSGSRETPAEASSGQAVPDTIAGTP